MGLAANIILRTATTLLWALELCMLVRAVLSWFPIREDHPFLSFLCMVTEPIIQPIRHLFDRMGWFRNLPLDVPFFAACLVLAAVNTLLSSL